MNMDMRLQQQYQELLRLQEEIDAHLEMGSDFPQMRELMLSLAKDTGYQKLKTKENRLIQLDRFFGIWLEERRKLPALGSDRDIFYGINSLAGVEKKYQRILYLGLRIENHMPLAYARQAMDWMEEWKISGIAIGRIIAGETHKGRENLLRIAQEMKDRGELQSAVLLLQYANEQYPGEEALLLEEAECWLRGEQWEKACELLELIKEPTAETRQMIQELRQVMENG